MNEYIVQRVGRQWIEERRAEAKQANQLQAWLLRPRRLRRTIGQR